MKRALSRVAIGLALGSVLLLALGGLALATLPTQQDFAPFTMRTTGWTADAIQREGQAPQAGTVVQLLEYRSRESWKVTVVSSSWDPGVVGTTVEVNSGAHTTFVSQARRLFSRIIPQGEVGRMAPFPWVAPGIVDGLSTSPVYKRLSSSPAGTAAFVRRDSAMSVRLDGTVNMVTGTVLVFDLASGLPLSTRTYRDGNLAEAVTYEVLSRP